MLCRLDELKQGYDSSSGDDLGENSEHSDYMKTFFSEVSTAQKMIAEVKNCYEDIIEIEKKAVHSRESLLNQEWLTELGEVTKLGNQKAAVSRAYIEQMRNKYETNPCDSVSAGETLIQENMICYLYRQCVQTGHLLLKAQQDCRSVIHGQLRRQVQLHNPSLSTEELQEIVSSGKALSVVVSSMEKGEAVSVNGSVQVCRDEAEYQQQQLCNIEANMVELHGMFVDFSNIVEAQGEFLDSIERSISKTAMNVEEGNNLINDAVNSRIGMSMMMFAPGLVIRNESEWTILVVLSQLTPLHWEAIDPGHTVRMKCGRVFFTVSAEKYDEKKVPTKLGVAGRMVTITAATVGSALVGLGPAGLAVTGTLSGVTSVGSASINGVYADGKTVVFGGRINPDSGKYELYCEGTEKTDPNQKMNRPAVIQKELVSVEKKDSWRPGKKLSRLFGKS